MFRDRDDIYLEEAVGFPISRNLCDQLRAWRFSPEGPVGIESHVVVDSTPEGQAVADACRAAGTRTQVTVVPHGTDWTLDRDSSGLVPPPVINLLFDRIGGRS